MRARSPAEQALADRLGRLFTDAMPEGLLAELVIAEDRRPGLLFQVLGESGFNEFAGALWVNFWAEFKEAQLRAAARAAGVARKS